MGIDFLFINGNILPMADPSERATTLAVEKRRIVFVGNHVPDALSHQAKITIDLDGKTLVPGLIDTHACFSAMALSGLGPSVSQAESFSDLSELLQAAAKQRSRTRIVFAHSLQTHRLSEQEMPDRKSLDDMVNSKPVLLLREDGRIGIGNTLLFERLGLEIADAPTPSGKLSGAALATTLQILLRRVGPKGRVRAHIRAANQALNFGVTSLHTFEDPHDLTMRQVKPILRSKSAMPIRLTNFVQTTDSRLAAQLGFRRVCAFVAPNKASWKSTEDYLLHREGFDSSRTPDLLPTFSEEELLNDFVLNAHRRHMQIALCAVDGDAIEMALNALEWALHRAPRVDARHRIEHCTLPTPKQVQRLSSLGIAATVQLGALQIPSKTNNENESTNKPMIPLRSLLDANVLVGYGSSAPRGLLNPFAGLANACNHPDPTQRITPFEALSLCTTNAARLVFEESDKGMLLPGKLADLVVLNEDPTLMPPDKIATCKVEATFLNGQPFVAHSASISKFLWRIFKGKIRHAMRIS